MMGNLVSGIASAAQAFTNDWQASAPMKFQQHSTLSPWQKTLAKSMSGMLQSSLFGQPAKKGQPAIPGAFTGAEPTWAYPGQRVAGTSPLQQQYMDLAPQYAQGQAPLDAMYQYGQRYANDVIAPNVMENFAGLGTANSGGAMKGLARELGTYGMNLNSQIGQAEMQNRQLNMQGLSQLGAAGDTQRGIYQQQLTGQQQAWAEQSPWNSPAMQYAFQMLPSSGQYVENTAHRQTEEVGPFDLLNKIN